MIKFVLTLSLGMLMLITSAQQLLLKDDLLWLNSINSEETNSSTTPSLSSSFANNDSNTSKSNYLSFSSDIPEVNFDVVMPENIINYVVSFKLNIQSISQTQSFYKLLLPLEFGKTESLVNLSLVKQNNGFRILMTSGNEREISKSLISTNKEILVVMKFTGIKGTKLKTELFVSDTGTISDKFSNVESVLTVDLPKEKRYKGFGKHILMNTLYPKSVNIGGVKDLVISEGLGNLNSDKEKKVLSSSEVGIDVQQANYGILSIKSTYDWDNATISIIDMNSIPQQQLTNIQLTKNLKNNLSIKSLPKGFYIIKIQDLNNQYQQKVIIN